MRTVLGIEYDGTKFAGGQIQPRRRTVQGCLQESLNKVDNHATKIVVAGRTDSGVHALSQVIHFDTKSFRSERNWVLGINAHLPCDINVIWAKDVDDDFSARFSAIRRSYRYLLINRTSRSGIYVDRMWWILKSLDEKRMQEAADLLIGYYDFSAFRAKDCQAKNTMKTIELVKVVRRENCITVDVVAQSFLHHMVRNIVGTLVLIGQGKMPVEWAKQILESKDRGQAGITSPPQGLYLASVEYHIRYALPTVSASPVFW